MKLKKLSALLLCIFVFPKISYAITCFEGNSLDGNYSATANRTYLDYILKNDPDNTEAITLARSCDISFKEEFKVVYADPRVDYKKGVEKIDKAVWAGTGFDYPVAITSKIVDVNYTPLYNEETREYRVPTPVCSKEATSTYYPEVCSSDVLNTGGSDISIEANGQLNCRVIAHDYNGQPLALDDPPGPNEDYENCIMKCDNGEYSEKCSNQCFDEVYNSIGNSDLTSFYTDSQYSPVCGSNCIGSERTPLGGGDDDDDDDDYGSSGNISNIGTYTGRNGQTGLTWKTDYGTNVYYMPGCCSTTSSGDPLDGGTQLPKSITDAINRVLPTLPPSVAIPYLVQTTMEPTECHNLRCNYTGANGETITVRQGVSLVKTTINGKMIHATFDNIKSLLPKEYQASFTRTRSCADGTITEGCTGLCASHSSTFHDLCEYDGSITVTKTDTSGQSTTTTCIPSSVKTDMIESCTTEWNTYTETTTKMAEQHPKCLEIVEELNNEITNQKYLTYKDVTAKMKITEPQNPTSVYLDATQSPSWEKTYDLNGYFYNGSENSPITVFDELKEYGYIEGQYKGFLIPDIAKLSIKTGGVCYGDWCEDETKANSYNYFYQQKNSKYPNGVQYYYTHAVTPSILLDNHIEVTFEGEYLSNSTLNVVKDNVAFVESPIKLICDYEIKNGLYDNINIMFRQIDKNNMFPGRRPYYNWKNYTSTIASINGTNVYEKDVCLEYDDVSSEIVGLRLTPDLINKIREYNADQNIKNDGYQFNLDSCIDSETGICYLWTDLPQGALDKSDRPTCVSTFLRDIVGITLKQNEGACYENYGGNGL